MNPAILALAALSVSQDVPPLIPETPPGWRGERLAFPLDFAPDIELEGYEVLRFAPGMFTADAPDYWSYLFGIHIEEDLPVSEEFLEDFLTRYYFGLCRAVGEGRGIDMSEVEFGVEVRRVGGRYEADIQLVDAFVTGEALSLSLEIDVDPGASTTALFAIASPAPDDAPIWKQLRGLRDDWRAARPAAFLLNHVYFVVDQPTYDALRDNTWLRESFAPNEERATVRKDMSYSGLYLYGESTYFEFLPAGVSPQLAAEGTGLAFGFEVAGGTAAAAARLEEAGIQTFVGPVTRQVGEAHVPWFEMLGVQAPHARSRLNTFTLEYDPRFLGAWHPEATPGASGVARREVLERYAAHLGQGPGVLRDVVAVHLSLDQGERQRLTDVVRTLGWEVRPGEGALHLDGPQVDLHVTPSDEPGGITGLDFLLREEVEREPLELGELVLTFDGWEARLRQR